MNGKLKVGLWRMNITPPLNLPVIGGFVPGVSESISDELYAHALVINDGKNEIAIVAVDIISIPLTIVKSIKEKIEQLCAIPAGNIILAASHTHTSAELLESSDAYTEYTKDCIVSAVMMAQKRKEPARISIGRDRNEQYIFNRRLRKPDGSIVMNWIDPSYFQDCTGDGIVDPELIALRIENSNGEPIGFIVNYANHNNSVTSNTRSSDISGHIGTLLRKIYGDHVVTLFLLGACGDVNWVNYRATGERSPLLYQHIAQSLTGTLLQMMPQMEYPPIDEIEILSETLLISERPYNDYDDKVDQTFGPQSIAYEFFANAKKNGQGNKLETYEVDIHVVKLGRDIAIATNPSELFVEYGLEIKEKSSFNYTVVSELTNGSVGYVPTLEAYEEGGYEVRKPANRLEKDAGIRIVNTTLKLLNELSK